MLTNERHAYILQLLEEKQTVKIQQLVESTGASESTIRRDLTDLEQLQKLTRVFGGATVTGQNLLEPSIFDKSTQFLDEKIKIAEFASSLVQQGDSVFLDAGTTTFQLIPFLKDKDLVVVTNGLTLVEALNEQGITTYLTGGLMKPRTGAFVGSQTIQALQNYRFDSCFLGINGCHPDYGYTTPDPEEAAVKQVASSLARKTFVLADHSKINKISFAKIMDLERATLIVDEISKEANAMLEKKTIVKVVTR
ncbi:MULTISPECIES: DeoR/GlpR family DNA-binding transcription regulator [Planococcus]|uniref:DeoR family transcriptional regulator n=2 Tax=Planococcus TaxID=1372 RepID=A0ABN4JYX6_9BACL|nr:MULTISPECIES: DeoR/GlpR family DNA-binding transcription regulator [Planococcus]ALS78699.1 DeoR family transcriptional regulator [Planococcus kocurii]AQU79343.1 DeoR family transcriptional regulator [Planococcus faecalis]MDJ0333099.1 DeoR/GlpR family DNA-binding transcription regulator [Planococcus sp. S3-L1]